MTPQELKNSILQRAIEGKLVEQRVEEGTGAELFEKIQKEKKKLIKEGKIKKQKALPEITEDEIPFEIPENWKWVRLNDCLDVRDGTHDTPKYIEKGYPLVTSKNLKNGIIDFSGCKFISKEDHRKISERSRVEINDILFAMIGSIGNPVKVKVSEEFSIKNMALFKPIIKDFNMDYLFWFLYFSQNNMKKIAYGAVQTFVSLTFLREYLLPIPPLGEQKRIVEKIEELMPLVDEYEENWQKLEEFNQRFPEDMKKSLLQEAIKGKLVEQRKEEGTGAELFEKIQKEKKKLVEEGKLKKQKSLEEIKKDEIPFEIPENWKWVRLNDCLDVRDGTHDTPKYIEKGYPLVTSKNLKNGIIDFSGCKFISKEDHRKISERSRVEINDILFAMIGSIGNPVKVKVSEEFSIKNMALFKPIIKDFNMDYLFWFLYFSQNNMKKIAYGAVQTFVSLTFLREYLIPLPPLAEQKRIVERLEELLPLCEKLITKPEK